MITDAADIKSILVTAKTIAVVGASPKPWRDSGTIAHYLARKGYTVYPVNPKYQEVFAMKCYPDLQSIQSAIDIVDIFRNPDEVEPIVDEAIKVHARCIWMQLGVVNEEGAIKAERSGLYVVMDRCIAVEHRLLMS